MEKLQGQLSQWANLSFQHWVRGTHVLLQLAKDVHGSVCLAIRRQRQQVLYGFKAGLVYIINSRTARLCGPCLKTHKQKTSRWPSCRETDVSHMKVTVKLVETTQGFFPTTHSMPGGSHTGSQRGPPSHCPRDPQQGHRMPSTDPLPPEGKVLTKQEPCPY